jgi:hypothetical protein
VRQLEGGGGKTGIRRSVRQIEGGRGQTGRGRRGSDRQWEEGVRQREGGGCETARESGVYVCSSCFSSLKCELYKHQSATGTVNIFSTSIYGMLL